MAPVESIYSMLHALGFRFRLHRGTCRAVPIWYSPDGTRLSLRTGCFWHGHACPMCHLPATRTAFWQAKILGNRDRDQRAAEALSAAGWRVLVVWECALGGPAQPAGRGGAGALLVVPAERAAVSV